MGVGGHWSAEVAARARLSALGRGGFWELVDSLVLPQSARMPGVTWTGGESPPHGGGQGDLKAFGS